MDVLVALQMNLGVGTAIVVVVVLVVHVAERAIDSKVDTQEAVVQMTEVS